MEFVLLVQSHRSGCCWGDAAITAGQAFEIWVKVVFIWPSGSYDGFLGKSHIHTESAELGKMSPDKDMFSNDNEATAVFEWSQRNKGCVLHAEEVGCGWQDIFGIPETGAILVRPDDHCMEVKSRTKSLFYSRTLFSLQQSADETQYSSSKIYAVNSVQTLNLAAALTEETRGLIPR